MDNKALTETQTNNAVVQYEAPDALAGLVNLRPSNIDLIQLTSRVPGSIAGKYRDSVSTEHYDAITVVPLNVTKGRVMFPPDKSDFTLKPICRSSDGIVPSQYIETPQSSSCASCRYSKWGKENGRSIRPACNETFTMTVIVKESELPRRLQFKGTGIKPFMDFMERIETDRVKQKAKDGRKPNLFEYFFTMTTQEIIGKSGKYFIPMFTSVNRVADPNTFGPFFKQYILDAFNEEDGQDAAIDVSVESVINSANPVHNATFVDA